MDGNKDVLEIHRRSFNDVRRSEIVKSAKIYGVYTRNTPNLKNSSK